MNLRIFSLYSGSSGNAFLIANERADGTECILIDGGKNSKRLCACLAECGYSPEQIRAVLVTHEHCDHISALPVFTKRFRIPVHAVGDTAEALVLSGVNQELVISHSEPFRERIGGFFVTAFPTPHDSRASVGYRIETEIENGFCRIGYATDMGTLTDSVRENLTGCDYVILESNHDLDMLWNGRYPYPLKKRIAGARGHLSNADCAAFAAELAESGTKRILLAHLSRENNTPEFAYQATAEQLSGKDVLLRVAAPEKITELI